MKTVDRIATFYGGGDDGSHWQVNLSKGSCFVIGDKDNQFKISGQLSGTWVSYTNRSREIHFDIQSPGITTVHRQDIKDDRYLLSCWMPSEEQDGVPHAMMGMWLLVDGR